MKLKRIALSSILLLMFLGCKTEIELNHYYNPNKPFTLIISKELIDIDYIPLPETLEVGSVKWNKTTEWLEKNSLGWEKNFNSYIYDLQLVQDEFKLRRAIGTSAVVLNFNDKNGTLQHYTKIIDEQELDFLID